MERKKKEVNWEEDVSIDQSALDVEWLEQPRLMFKYGQYQAECKAMMDLRKEQMETQWAEVDGDIREDPGKYGITKITESAIKNAVLLDGDYQSAQEQYNEARYEYEMAKVAVVALDQKKTALENLVKLHGQMYFAGPSVPRDLSKEWEKREKGKRVDAGVHISPRKN